MHKTLNVHVLYIFSLDAGNSVPETLNGYETNDDTVIHNEFKDPETVQTTAPIIKAQTSRKKTIVSNFSDSLTTASWKNS